MTRPGQHWLRLLTISALAAGASLPGGATWPFAAACAATLPPPSLSGVLAIPEPPPEQPLKDPFSPPSTLLPTAPSAPQRTAAEEPPLLLTAILWRSDQASAVVNGTILRPGDQYLGMRVLSISRDQVHFQRGEGQLSLIMHQPLYNFRSAEGE